MKKTLKVYFAIIMILCSANVSYSQNQEKIDKWLKIKPLISIRKDVEETFGKAEEERENSSRSYLKNSF
jgi:hypothetical protein